jgi:hypothetical protein
VYLTAIAGHVPSEMVKCLAAFMDFCYLVRCNVLTSDMLHAIEDTLACFHHHHDIFIQCGVRFDISLPRQWLMLFHD